MGDREERIIRTWLSNSHEEEAVAEPGSRPLNVPQPCRLKPKVVSGVDGVFHEVQRTLHCKVVDCCSGSSGT